MNIVSIEKISSQTDSKKHTTIVLSGFEFDLPGGSATVHRRLFHRSINGTWTLVLSSKGSSVLADIKLGQVDSIEKDPQVQQIASVIRGLGIGQEKLSTALQMGAVVQQALNQAEQSFQTSVLDIIAAKDAVRTQELLTIRLSEEPLEQNSR